MLVRLEAVVQFIYSRVNKLSEDSVFVGDIYEALEMERSERRNVLNVIIRE